MIENKATTIQHRAVRPLSQIGLEQPSGQSSDSLHELFQNSLWTHTHFLHTRPIES